MARPPTSGFTAAQVLAPVLRRGVADLRTAEAGVRLDRAHAVHDFRVAGRKLRSVLRSTPTLFESTDELSTGLGEVGQAAGPTRDTEVLRRRLMEALAEEPAGTGLLQLRERLDRELEEVRRRHWIALVDYLDGQSFDGVARRLDSFSDLTPWSAAADEPAREVLAPLLDLQRRRLKARLQRLATLPPGDEIDEKLHDVRKLAKTVRYLSDALTPALGERPKKARKALGRLHTVLGDLNDSHLVVAFLDQELGREVADGQERQILRRARMRETSNAASLRSAFLEENRLPHRRTSAS